MLNIAALTDAGIDTEEGMAYCADDPEFYEEMRKLAHFVIYDKNGFVPITTNSILKIN